MDNEQTLRSVFIYLTPRNKAVGKFLVGLREDLRESDMVTLVGHTHGLLKGLSSLYVLPGYL